MKQHRKMESFSTVFILYISTICEFLLKRKSDVDISFIGNNLIFGTE